jgi:3-hydroxyisobutyrate dehydrogenase-like beta-hydroxyacid dehydrogenase
VTPEKVAFLCLGTMGAPMAGHLARAGHALSVYNRTPARAQRFAAEHAVRVAATPAQAAAGARFVFACTGDDGDLRAIATGPEGAFAGMAPGACFVDHTTTSAQVARELAGEASARGLRFLDAPVSGGESGAQQGALTVMVGGEAEALESARGLLTCYAKRIVHIGPSGAGQLAKLVNQICIAGLLQALAEGLRFTECAGLDAERVLEAISGGAAQSWQMDHRAHSMLRREFDFGFAVDWMRKDLRHALAEARRSGAPLPVTELVDRFYAELQAAGGGRRDTSSLIARLG